jgi:hypothetical protein
MPYSIGQNSFWILSSPTFFRQNKLALSTIVLYAKIQSSKLSNLHLFLYSAMSMVHKRIYNASNREDTCENIDEHTLETCVQ